MVSNPVVTSLRVSSNKTGTVQLFIGNGGNASDLLSEGAPFDSPTATGFSL
jgi:hypothetical protein